MDSWIYGFKDLRIQGFMDVGIKGFQEILRDFKEFEGILRYSKGFKWI